MQVCHSYDEVLTGGVIAMHYLAYLLAKEGHNVYIFCKPEYPHENIHVINSWIEYRDSEKELGETVSTYRWENFKYSHSNTVAVYPQTTWGNWFGTHHVVRWLLYDTEKIIEDTWNGDDYYFSYGKQKNLNNNYKGKDCKELIAMNLHLGIFKNDIEKDRSGFCHLFHKHTSLGAEGFVEELNSTNLTEYITSGGFVYLNEEFNKHEYFICYDQLSFWPQVAALCGCKVVVMNVEDNPNAYYDYNTTPEEYRLENPLKKYGVAFGFEDLRHAVSTQHLVKDHLEEIDKQNLETVKEFCKFWENKCYG